MCMPPARAARGLVAEPRAARPGAGVSYFFAQVEMPNGR
jgi:hypothetical protein